MVDTVLELDLAVEAASVVRARRAVEAFAGGHGVCPGTMHAVRLAVSEACGNVVVHAYRGRADGPFRVTAEVDGERDLRITVRDEGHGMRPRLDSPGLGLGLPLIATVTDDLQVERDGGATRVCMRFGLDRPPAAFADLA
jgi:serine/threonine-protein kinase RsbW